MEMKLAKPNRINQEDGNKTGIVWVTYCKRTLPLSMTIDMPDKAFSGLSLHGYTVLTVLIVAATVGDKLERSDIMVYSI
jgi:branched-subunit amino acid transport protein